MAGGQVVSQADLRHTGQMPAAVLLADVSAAQRQAQRDAEEAAELGLKIKAYLDMERDEEAELAVEARARAMSPTVRASWRLIHNLKEHVARQRTAEWEARCLREHFAEVEAAREAGVAPGVDFHEAHKYEEGIGMGGLYIVQ